MNKIFLLTLEWYVGCIKIIKNSTTESFPVQPLLDCGKKVDNFKLREDFKKKKSKISDIGKKGRVGWDQKTYF